MRPSAVIDLEVYRNYFLVAMKDLATGRVATFEHPLDLERLKKILCRYRLISFNGLGYDIPMLMLALKGVSTQRLKDASNRIITHNLKPWNFAREFDVDLNDPAIHHVDLMEVAPLKGSLKVYGGRMHSRHLQNLPVHHDAELTDEEKVIVREYCKNDLSTTEDLYNTLKVQLELRQSMSAQYGIDLMSKSDAQIAEAVVKSEIEKLKGQKIQKPGTFPGQKFQYQIPSWMSYKTLTVLDMIRKAEFIVNDKGGVMLPPELKNAQIKIGHGVYRMGIGGLHSSEESVHHHADNEHVLIDRDVTSYYPSILLTLNLFPKHIGPEFTQVYRNIVETRLAAKKAGQKTIAESLKICVNGLFGKLGSRYSIVYAPELLIQVTLTGQLALLMLIEALEEDSDITVVSANTDGVFVKCRKGAAQGRMEDIFKWWETTTGFRTEEERYSALYSRDVNNYIAIKTNGHSAKTKGVYGEGLPLQKNPVTRICAEAVIDYLTLDADIPASIRECKDIRKFLTLRNVTGGATWRGQELGKVIRWYYATDEDEAILNAMNGYLVPKTLGAKPLMVLPETFPTDVNYEWYINECYGMLKELGVS